MEKAYDALTEPEDQADSEGSGNISPNTSKESTESTENTDTIIRSDPNESLENLINTLENSSDSSENSDNGNRTVLEMDEDNNGVETPKSIKKSTHFSEPQKYGENFENYNSGYMTLQMPEQVIARSLNFMQNSTPSEDGTITPVDTPNLPNTGDNTPTGASAIPKKDARTNQISQGLGVSQAGGELSNFRFGYTPTPSDPWNNPQPSSSRSATGSRENNTFTKIPSDPRIKIGVIQSDIPPNISQSIMNYKPGNITSEEENAGAYGASTSNNTQEKLPHSLNSVFPLRTSGIASPPERMDTYQPPTNEVPFQTPKKFSANFQKLIREKSKKTITTTQNKFQALTDMSESESSEYEDEIKKIVKRKRKMRKQREENPDNNVAQTHTNASNVVKPTEITKTSTKPNTIQNTPKKRQQCHL